jgi:serine/threonine protein kinase
VTLPCRFAGYELLEEIGRGGMGIVYRARQVGLDREVAVKMILRGPLASGVDRQRFRVEAEATARLEHAEHRAGVRSGRVAGGALFQHEVHPRPDALQPAGPATLPPREAARILAAVAHGIHYAHRHGILHRDLKPSNILVDQQGQPLVTDFGLAKRTGNGAVITQTGDVLGTPAYMAPEQAAGDRGQVGPASDVYSLGAILYHC